MSYLFLSSVGKEFFLITKCTAVIESAKCSQIICNNFVKKLIGKSVKKLIAFPSSFCLKEYILLNFLATLMSNSIQICISSFDMKVIDCF